MTWLWKVPDMRTRVAFARRNAPGDIFTQIARFIVYYLSSLLIFVLKPVDYLGRSIFKVAFHMGTVIGFFYVFGLLFFMLAVRPMDTHLGDCSSGAAGSG